MSQVIYLECDQCRESVWVGQENYIYKDAARIVAYFILRHYGHQIVPRVDNHSMIFNRACDPWYELEFVGSIKEFVLRAKGIKPTDTIGPDDIVLSRTPINTNAVYRGFDRDGNNIHLDFETEHTRCQEKYT